MTDKQKKYIEDLAKRIGFKSVDQQENYIQALVNSYSRLVGYEGQVRRNGMTFPATNYFDDYDDCFNELKTELKIKGDRQITVKKDFSKSISASGLGSYTFCPASFSIHETIDVEMPKRVKTGIELHESKKLFELLQAEVRTGEGTSTQYIGDFTSKFIEMLKKYFRNNPQANPNRGAIAYQSKNNVHCIPDYIIQDENGNHVVVEEKFQYLNQASLAGGFDPSGAESSLDLSKLQGYPNHKIQLLAYLKNIVSPEIKYGVLIYWYYSYFQDGPSIQYARAEKIELNRHYEESYDRAFSGLSNLVTKGEEPFNVDSVNPNKCVNCSATHYCMHKTKRFSTVQYPYPIDQIRLY